MRERERERAEKKKWRDKWKLPDVNKTLNTRNWGSSGPEYYFITYASCCPARRRCLHRMPDILYMEIRVRFTSCNALPTEIFQIVIIPPNRLDVGEAIEYVCMCVCAMTKQCHKIWQIPLEHQSTGVCELLGCAAAHIMRTIMALLRTTTTAAALATASVYQNR